jgi:hypothetical protein
MASVVTESQGEPVILSHKKRDRPGIEFHVPKMAVVNAEA